MPNVDQIKQRNEDSAALLTAMFKVANQWKGTTYLLGGNSTNGIDCSHFIYQVINGARLATAAQGIEPQVVEYRSTSTIEASNVFIRVANPQAGDLVMWDGHVGIVIDPLAGSFIGAQTSTGVAESNYKTNEYWQKRGVKGFLRFAYLF